ncbi:helix-turn-helix domain-containing protein [Kitasatospora sp. NPDC057936]|uniref:helix-turn-helix domain-containing protein n=1 Tax=Kitasatospora sp. NPDC057936 TaxID=3346283 RepID=UPI0036DDD264
MSGRNKAGVQSGPAEELARFLRRLRRRPDGTNLTYKEMADRIGGKRYCSAPTLSRADQGGNCIPRIETVQEYALACGASPDQLQHARRLLSAARRLRLLHATASRYDDPKAGARIARQAHPAVAPHPNYMRSRLDFQNGLRSYHREVGSPSVRAISANAELSGLHITKSTAHRMLSTGLDPTWEQVHAFLTGCRPGKLPDLLVWRQAWDRVFGGPAYSVVPESELANIHFVPVQRAGRLNRWPKLETVRTYVGNRGATKYVEPPERTPRLERAPRPSSAPPHPMAGSGRGNP